MDTSSFLSASSSSDAPIDCGITPAGSPPFWPPPAVPEISGDSPGGELESISYTWRPAEDPERISIEASVPRARLARVLRFELLWAPLNASERSRVWTFLARHSEGEDDYLEKVVAVLRLYDMSLGQTHPAMTPAERLAEVGQALAIPWEDEAAFIRAMGLDS
jgi:hypothetical protein